MSGHNPYYTAGKWRRGRRGLQQFVAAAARAGRALRHIAGSVRDPGRRLRAYLGGKRASGRHTVRTLSTRGGNTSHPILSGKSAFKWHVIHDRARGAVQIIGEDRLGKPTVAHEWATDPAVVRPAQGRGNPNLDIPILGPIVRVAESVRRGFEDIGHLFGV